VKLIIQAGKANGVEPKDVVEAIVDQTHLENDDVRNVRVLERFALVEVPTGEASRVVESVTQVHGRPVALEPIRS
jgi:ATP-dependent RNA helicase DeaD